MKKKGLVDRSKVGKRSMRKGQGFEREVAKILSAWWGTENSFVRTPLSGGWTKRTKFLGEERKQVAGDLICPSDFPFVISCKKVESFKFHTLIADWESSLLRKWWFEVKEEAESVGKRPMLVFSKNRWKKYVCISNDDFKKLFIKCNCFCINIPSEAVSLVIFTFDEWCKQVLPDSLIMEFGLVEKVEK